MSTPTPLNSEPERDPIRERVDRAEHVLATHYRWNRNRSVPDELCELLIDLMHWAYHDDTDFGEKCGWAEAVFEEELKANPPASKPYRVTLRSTRIYTINIKAEDTDAAVYAVEEQIKKTAPDEIAGMKLLDETFGSYQAEEVYP